MELSVLMRTERDIVVSRVENGWMVRTFENGLMSARVVRVAETTEALVSLLTEWAHAQEADALAGQSR